MAINKNFVVKNGFEASTDLIAADAVTRRVGVGTTVATHTLHVNGGIGATTIVVSGIGTFANELNVGSNGSVLTALGIGGSVGIGSTLPSYLLDVRSPVSTGQTALYVYGDAEFTGIINANAVDFANLIVSGIATFNNVTLQGYVSAGNTIGINNQVLVSTGAGVTWKDTGSGISTLGITTATNLTLQQLNVSGISTFSNIFINGYVSAGNTFGQANQVLVSTGVGVTWKDTGSLRTTTTFTATAAQTTFSISYNLTTSLDVFVNGVKLTNTEFTATSGTDVVLDDVCFGDEVVEIITYDIDFPLNFTGVTIKEEGSIVANNVNTLNFVGLAITAIATSGSASTISIDAQPPLNSGSQVTVGIITATSVRVGSGTTIDSSGINVTGIITSTDINSSNINSSNINVTGIITSTNIQINGDINITGIITAGSVISNNGIDCTTGAVFAPDGFVSTANTTPIQIQLVGNLLTFQAVGIGSTTFTLF